MDLTKIRVLSITAMEGMSADETLIHILMEGNEQGFTNQPELWSVAGIRARLLDVIIGQPLKLDDDLKTHYINKLFYNMGRREGSWDDCGDE